MNKVTGCLQVVISIAAASLTCQGQGIISTVAGGAPWNFVSTFGSSGPASNAPFGRLLRVTADSAGNVFAADWENSVVVKISPNGTLTVVAGNGTSGISGDGGLATAAQVGAPQGMAMDSAGNLYIADCGYGMVRKVSPAGIISTVAGTGGSGYSGDGGPAISARLSFPIAVTLDASGNLYIADSRNNRIRMVTPAGVISTVAGTGVASYSGDGGPATSAALNNPEGVLADSAGNVYIADSRNSRVRKIAPNGIISTIAGNGTDAYPSDGVPATNTSLVSPAGMALDATGNLYVAQESWSRIRKINTAGIISTVAGSNSTNGFSGDGGPAASASLYDPRDVAMDAAGSLYIADSQNNRIRKVTPDGTISTLAGNGSFHSSGDGGPATGASLDTPVGVAVDAAGNIYIADEDSSRVRKVTAGAGGLISAVAGNGTPSFSGDGGPASAAAIFTPAGAAVDAAGNVYIVDSGNDRIRKVTTGGTISTVAGGGTQDGDGIPATSARMAPTAMAVDVSGNLYIADSGTRRIRKVSSGGIISTIAGNGTTGFSGDGGPAVRASMDESEALAVDATGNLYIADSFNNVVRKVDSTGIISTIAGNGTYGFFGDGGPAAGASLRFPDGLAVDATGNLYIADFGNGRIRKVTSAGIISSIAGSGAGFSGDGGSSVNAALNSPIGLAVDAVGNLYIADRDNSRVRKISFTPLINPSGVVLAAGFSPGPVAPGALVSIFGVNFSNQSGNAPGLPLPTRFNGTRVLVNGTEAPLFYAGPNQVNVQIPFELAAGQSASIVVEDNGVPSATQTVQIDAYRPGIFTLGGSYGNQGAILLSNTNLLAMPVTAGIPSQPVRVGDPISIYCTGLGVTNPLIPTNTPGPNSPAAIAVLPSVSIGGVQTPLSFAGLAPGFVGLYQVNAQIPKGTAASNTVSVVLTQGSVSSNTATIAVQ